MQVNPRKKEVSVWENGLYCAIPLHSLTIVIERWHISHLVVWAKSHESFL